MSISNALVEAEVAGRTAGSAFNRGDRAALDGPLGRFNATGSPKALALRRFLIGLRMPPRALGWLLAILPEGGRDRFERFLTSYAFWLGVRREIRDPTTWADLTDGPIILMYHAVAAADETPSMYAVSAASLRRQLMVLRLFGYRVISFAELVEYRARTGVGPGRSAVITFDDGYRDNLELALPLLRRDETPATIFVVSGCVGGAANWTRDPALGGRPLLAREDLKTLRSSAIEIGAHTRTHPSLSEIGEPAREDEVRGSRQDLEAAIGEPVETFAYPYGDYDPGVVETVSRAGYRAACCSRSGKNDPSVPIHELRRLEVRGTDSLFTFMRFLWRGHRSGRGGK